MNIKSFFSLSMLAAIVFLNAACSSTETTTTETTENTDATTETEVTIDTNQEKPTQFASLEKMIEELGDYSIDDGTFEKMSDTQIRISPSVPESADEAEVRQIVQTSLITLVMRTFIHTELADVTVKVVPQKATFNPEEAEMMEDYATEATISRSTAEQVAKDIAGVELNSLVGNKIGELFRADMQNDNMIKLTSADNLDKVYSQLTNTGGAE